jgi:pimeloyl-ACP methyl ester carboxylesterase
MSAIVLIHGAFQGGWIWKLVAERLLAKGHRVWTPTLEGCAERRTQVRAGINIETQATEVAELLFFEDLKDVVLVGTSTGGSVMTRAAELARSRLSRLVFADAVALFDGEALPDIISRTPAVNTALTWGPLREDLETKLFAELDPSMRQWAIDRCTPHPLAAMTDPARLQTFWDDEWDASVILCKRSRNPSRAHQLRAKDRLNAGWHELDTGHYPMLTEPDALVRLILEG